MTEFGHHGTIIPGFGCIDSWGSGPFEIKVGEKKYRFEDSDRFGPALIRRDGELRANPYPRESSPFWRAHRIWVRQGRRTLDDGVTCVWDEPKPQVLLHISGRNHFIIEDGEEDGKVIVKKDAALLEQRLREEGIS